MKKLDETLATLLIGIVIFEVVALVAGVFFVESPVKYIIGLLVGSLLACLSAYHMWYTLDKNLTINADNENGAKAYSIKSSMIRYVVILIVFVVICVTDFAYPLSAFLGIMGLKAGAYIQPLVVKIINKSSK